MTSDNLDIAAILAALGVGLPDDPEPRQPNNRLILQSLRRKGLPESIAKPVSMNELCFWTEPEVDALFSRVLATADEMADPKLRSFSVRATRGRRLDPDDFVKPSWAQVEASAAVLGALCVNRRGEFCVNPPEGYAALSHVWAHGLGSDDKNRGLHRSLVEQVFDVVAPLGVKWIWTDSLAIPGGGEDLEVVEEELKAILINAMADIYRNAGQVIVLDSLLLRLESVDPVEVAAVLSCAKWMSRVWTYQEVKLATKTVIATKLGFVGLSEMVQALKTKAQREVGNGYDSHKRGQFPSLYRTFHRLLRDDECGVSLPDIAIGCGWREAFDKLDYARAVFPTLGLQWRFGDSIDDAMRKIYEKQKRHATRLVLLHGPPRASYPGWAPAVFPGLVDSKITEGGIWKSRGMARSWLASKIKSIVPSKPGVIILELDNGQSPGAYCAGNISEATKQQSPKSIELFEAAVKSGTAYLLCDEPLIPAQSFARVGLLVERFTRSPDLEAWVCLTLAVGQAEETYKADKGEWLLLHENPADEKGKAASELRHMLEQGRRIEPAEHQAVEGRLHVAAWSGDLATIDALASEGVDVDQPDSRGWTPLHYASAAGHAAAVRRLASLGARLTAATAAAETPLVLAVDNGQQTVVCELLEAGADANGFAATGPSPLVVAARNADLEMTRLLLLFGADPAREDGYGFMPLMCAAVLPRPDGDDDGSSSGSLALLAELLAAGRADAAGAVTASGPGALEVAVRDGNVGATRLLLAHGAAASGAAGAATAPPLQHAMDARSVEAVEALLAGGARVVGVRFQEDQTPMMYAARVGDVPIGRLLRGKGAALSGVGGRERWTALHVAAVRGNALFFKWLVEEGKKPEGNVKWDEKDYKGWTAFELKKGDT